jgi:hypothetical protein
VFPDIFCLSYTETVSNSPSQGIKKFVTTDTSRKETA